MRRTYRKPVRDDYTWIESWKCTYLEFWASVPATVLHKFTTKSDRANFSADVTFTKFWRANLTEVRTIKFPPTLLVSLRSSEKLWCWNDVRLRFMMRWWCLMWKIPGDWHHWRQQRTLTCCRPRFYTSWLPKNKDISLLQLIWNVTRLGCFWWFYVFLKWNLLLISAENKDFLDLRKI